MQYLSFQCGLISFSRMSTRFLHCPILLDSFLNFIYLFLDRGEGSKKERQRNINVWLPPTHPPLDTCPTTQACGLTGNWTSGSQDGTQSTEPHQPGLYLTIVLVNKQSTSVFILEILEWNWTFILHHTQNQLKMEYGLECNTWNHKTTRKKRR